MEIHIPPPSKWNHKHIILVTLIGTMIAIAIVAVISISLSPAHIYLSITDAKASKGVEDTQFYNFTLVADNTSPRMAVLYGAQLNAEIWYSPTSWVPAVVEMAGRMQPPGKATRISVSGEYWQSEQASGDDKGKGGSPPPPTKGGGPINTSWSNCTVVVMAKVWFMAGRISTRSYNIRASCSKVNFRNHTAIVNCTHG